MHIHVVWQGPHTYAEMEKFNGPTDYGLYIVVGLHPIYGQKALLYIGEAHEQTFSKRFDDWDKVGMADPWWDNATNLEYYTGRIHKTHGERQPRKNRWIQTIKDAERLLIAAHAPSWNSQGISGIRARESDRFDDLHILNWGQYAMLLPEVSGIRYGWKTYESLADNPLHRRES